MRIYFYCYFCGCWKNNNNKNNKTIKTFKRLDPILILWERRYKDNRHYFWKKATGRKNRALKKKKKKHEIGTKNTGQKNIEKKNDFREKIEKRLKSLRALGKTISLLPQRTESRIMERFTREMWLHEILLHDRRNDTELKRCSKLRGSLRIDWFFSRYVTVDEKFSKISLSGGE